MMRSTLFAAFTLLLSFMALAAPAPLVFSATGDGPREPGDWELLRQYLVNEQGQAEYMLHLGDITRGQDELPEYYYAAVAALLKTSPVPVFIVPGDNEWNDLADPATGWQYWTQYFLGFHDNFSATPKGVVRQYAQPENMAWVDHGVLFVGLNIVGGTVHDQAEWTLRHSHNLAWVREQFDAHPEAHSAVVFAQARPKDIQEDFFAPFVEAAAQFKKPVLYLHGDGHRYVVEPAWRAANITRVQVDQVSKAPPLLITVTGDPAEPWLFDRRLGN